MTDQETGTGVGAERHRGVQPPQGAVLPFQGKQGLHRDVCKTPSVVQSYLGMAKIGERLRAVKTREGIGIGTGGRFRIEGRQGCSRRGGRDRRRAADFRLARPVRASGKDKG